MGIWAWVPTLWIYKVVTKIGQSLWVKTKLCLGPADVINCNSTIYTVLLSELASQSVWPQQWYH